MVAAAPMSSNPVRVPSADSSSHQAPGGAIEFRDVVFAVPESQAPSHAEGVSSSAAHRILNGITVSLEAGAVVALLGRSGSGKTTLLRTVNGLVVPTGGSVWVNGADVAQADLRTLRQGIGYVIQDTGLYTHMTLERNVSMALELAGKPLAERRARAAELLDRVGLPAAQFARRMPGELSGGQRQRAGVARALAGNPSILLMDEPFGALDPLTRADMQTLLRDLLAAERSDTHAGITALIVTHDLQEAIFLAGRVLFIDNGCVAANLPSHEVMTSTIPTVQEYVRAVQRFEAAG